ncbi:DUF3450 domain-containing protein [Pleionea litopenaei]|uniref:DUF3450 domain-containing protein n=1 Tax=Pleionea litopenaei TaxID=3070815 RepID=A0AA51RVV8_9GAMM|nr:DUF3450 domain-containing protein [Pleionea sp. HL-JVS1]WMS88562.1 DUF3450 domain-containing protein [Pleionea sp. HL-JVS1]
MLNKKISRIFAVSLAAVMGCFSGASIGGTLDPSVKVEVKIDKSAASAQKQIDRLAETTLDLNAEYKATLTQIEQFKAYNLRLEKSIASQEEEMESLQNQMNTIDETERGLMPLMDEMIERLGNFVELDVPFRKEQRLEDVDKLRQIMLRADVSTSEKYRMILGAYVDEIRYGKETLVYAGPMDIGGTEREVDFLQFGRTALMFATRGDNVQAAIWDKEAKDWAWLDGGQASAVRRAIKDINMKAKKLIVVPVATPEK